MNNLNTETIQIQEIPILITWKDIKNVHLSVVPPKGDVKISAPLRISKDNIRAFAISRLDWIRKSKEKFLNQSREPNREYIENESHYLFGNRYLLKIKENKKPSLTISNSKLILHIPGDATDKKRKEVFQEFYRDQLRHYIDQLLPKWKKEIFVPEFEYSIRFMKTKWGTCYHDKRKIWLNLELAKKPLECIEYVLVHEMVHLLEDSHNKRFIRLMDKYLPIWRELKAKLNDLPIHGEGVWNE